MKKKLKLPALLTTLLLSLRAFAQQDPMVSQYMFNGLFLNPAYAGVRSEPNITGVYRKQWVKFDGAPRTALLSYDQKVKNKKMGLGMIISNDEIGVTGQTDFIANYSYHLKLNDEKQISFGLSGGISNYRADLTKLTVWDTDDKNFTTDITGKWFPNFGTGVYFKDRKFYAGISVPRILSYAPSTNFHVEIDRAPNYERHAYLTSGYFINVSENITMKPSFLIKYVKDAPVQGDINLNTYYKNIFGIGVSYRTQNAFVAMAEFNTQKRIKIGYAFDYYFNELSKYSNGTHEIMLTYSFGKGKSMASFGGDGSTSASYGPETFW